MNGLRETCHCGHDKATHYVDHAASPPALCSCLARGCECQSYANDRYPRLPAKRKPVAVKAPEPAVFAYYDRNADTDAPPSRP